MMLNSNTFKCTVLFFQYQTTPSHAEEIDVCGVCQMTYEVVDDSTILKRKENCKFQSDVHVTPQSEPVIIVQFGKFCLITMCLNQ